MFRKSFRLSLLALLLLQVPASFAYQADKTAHTVTVSPGATPAATTTDLRNAFGFLISRPDKDTQWTMDGLRDAQGLGNRLSNKVHSCESIVVRLISVG